MSKEYFKDFDLSAFWDDFDYFTNPNPVTKKVIRDAESLLGYKLPDSYLELIRTKNGGTPVKTCFPTTTPTVWADDHVEISGILGISYESGITSKDYGSQYLDEEEGFPPIGIIVCESPSAGHDAIMLDYRKCGKKGDPKIVHVKSDEKTITFLANDFETFIKGLVHRSIYKNK